MPNPKFSPTLEVLPQSESSLSDHRLSLPGNVEDPAPPLQPGYQQTQKIILTSTGFHNDKADLTKLNFGDVPIRVKCPTCKSMVISRTTERPGTYSYIMAIFLCFFLLPCACAPFCMCKSLHDVIHNCPNCKAYLGISRGGC